MPDRHRAKRWTVATLAVALGLLAYRSESSTPQAAEDQAAAAPVRVPVTVARDRAHLMHEIYEEMLHMMHVHYFHGDRVAVPARAMEDVFEAMAKQSRGQAKWIAVNTKAMSIDHEPETPFEKQAAAQIAAGKSEVEVVEKGFYRRATAIPLTSGCIGCHVGFSADAGKVPRFAGLVINIPIDGK